eukprot:UN13424
MKELPLLVHMLKTTMKFHTKTVCYVCDILEGVDLFHQALTCSDLKKRNILLGNACLKSKSYENNWIISLCILGVTNTNLNIEKLYDELLQSKIVTTKCWNWRPLVNGKP